MWRDFNPNDDWQNDLDWSEYGLENEFWNVGQEDEIIVKDANWKILKAWDSVVAIKDLKVKWSNDIKRWDKFKNIRLTDDVELIESWKMVLRTEFFKKVD